MSEPQRSSEWPRVEREHKLKQPRCLVCGCDVQLNVHHKYPFEFVVAVGRPDLELDERNLFSLCTEQAEQHHVLIGHLDDYKSYNPHLEQLIALCRGLTSAQIRAFKDWADAKTLRPKELKDWTDADKAALKAELDKYMPRLT